MKNFFQKNGIMMLAAVTVVAVLSSGTKLTISCLSLVTKVPRRP